MALGQGQRFITRVEQGTQVFYPHVWRETPKGHSPMGFPDKLGGNTFTIEREQRVMSLLVIDHYRFGKGLHPFTETVSTFLPSLDV